MICTTLALQGASVSAVSVFDDSLQTVPDVQLGWSTRTPDDYINMNNSYSEVFRNTSDDFYSIPDYSFQWTGDALSNYSAIKDEWDNKIHWGVSQIRLGTSEPYSYRIEVWFTSDPDAYIQPVNYGSYGQFIYASQLHKLQMSYWSCKKLQIPSMSPPAFI